MGGQGENAEGYAKDEDGDADRCGCSQDLPG
jgi:hypothetical protein